MRVAVRSSFWPRVSSLTVISLGLSLGACATVKPFERGRLAERCMRVERDPQAASMEQHVYEYREGATGATGTTGGGCGCN